MIRGGMRAIVAGLVFMAAFLPESARGGTVFSMADTWIAQSLPDTPFGTDGAMGTGGAGAAAMVLFDLSAFAGHTVTAPATLTFVSRGVGGDTQGNISLTVHRALAPWNEATTWNSFGATPGATAGEDYDATVEGSFAAFVSLNQAFSLTIAASVLQGWIDNPASNRGFVLLGSSGFYLATREFTAGTHPQLTFNSEVAPPPPPSDVPEPTSIALLGAGAAAILLARARS